MLARWEEAFFASIQERIEPIDEMQDFLPGNARTPEQILIDREFGHGDLSSDALVIVREIFNAPREILEDVKILRKYLVRNSKLNREKVAAGIREIKRFLREN